MSVEDVIDNLSRLDLKICSDQEISELLDEVMRYVVPIIDIQPGQSFFRATVIGDDEDILSLNRLSYKPGLLNKKYQRASIPGETMFYATFPDMNEEYRTWDGIAAALFECAPCYRGKTIDGDYRMAVSEWKTISPISLMAMSSPFENKSVQLTECTGDFLRIAENEQDALSLIHFQEFLSQEFNKKVDHENEYRVSALFVRKLINNSKKIGKRIDGVAWQSAVNVDDKLRNTLSVAILPTIIDTCFLAPVDYYECIQKIDNGVAVPIHPQKRKLE